MYTEVNVQFWVSYYWTTEKSSQIKKASLIVANVEIMNRKFSSFFA